MAAKYIGAETRAGKVDRIFAAAYDRLSALLPTWREDDRLRTIELERLEGAALAAMGEYARGGQSWPGKRACEAWEAAMVQAITGVAIDPNKCATCGRDMPIRVQSSDGKWECSRCMQGYPYPKKE